MIFRVKNIVMLAALSLTPAALNAQVVDFKIFDRNVQVHGFASEGFAISNVNNYLTMNTSKGSLAMTDGGANISTSITDKFRVGAQIYDRKIGELGNWHPQLDWAFGDYKFKSWFGVRAGKVKTVVGLFNDTQDAEFLHTWAILPQSIYPLDLRASTIAHTGGDVYGTFGLKKAGDISYTVYAGTRPYDSYGGYEYGLQASGINIATSKVKQFGGDLRWNNLLKGLLIGASYLHQPESAVGTILVAPTVTFPFLIPSVYDETAAFYLEYKVGNLTLDCEYHRETITGTSQIGPVPPTPVDEDQRGWYASASYRVSKRLELGAYESRFYPVWGQTSAPAGNHMYDTVGAAKIALIGQWDLKIEGHFMDGYGSPYSFRGFYPMNNQAGLEPKTNMLVIRTGWNF